jgi:hypothetical protein
MAAGLGFKDFTTGEVLTANDVDGYLMQGVWVFASAAARDAAVTSPQEGNFCYLKDTNSTEYYSGSAWVALGGAKIGQIVQATTTTSTTTTSTSYVDATNVTASITPVSAASKILVTITAPGYCYLGGGNAKLGAQIVRGATSIADFGFILGTYHATDAAPRGLVSLSYIDSPATTSATSYKLQIKTITSGQGYINESGNSNLSTIILTEILS